MTKGPDFPNYDPQLAAGLLQSAHGVRGLPDYLGLRHIEFGPGVLVVQLDVRDELKTPFGNLHGGVLAAVCDHVLGTVCYPVMARGSWAATTEFKINYLAPVTDGEVQATARIVSLTRRTAVVRIDVTNDGRLVCIAQGTVLVTAPKPPGD